MVLDGHPKEDCIFQSTVPGSADGADKSRSHLWPPQAELLDELTGSLWFLLKKHKKVRSAVNLHTTPPTPSKNFPGTVAFHSMHLRCNLGHTRSKPPAIFEVLGAAQAQHSAASLAKVDQRSWGIPPLARMSVPMGTPWPTCGVGGASQCCQWCNEWEVSKTLPKLLQQREGNVSQLKQSSTVLHVSAWSQSSEIQQKPVLLVVLLSSSDAPSTVKTPWLTNAAFTASTTAFGGLPPGANPYPSWVSLSEL